MIESVYRVISQIMEVPIEEIDMNSSPDTIEKWDSLKHMNLILALEEEFNVSFMDNEIVEMLSVELIIETLKEKANAKGHI